jgi:hypothetical protein
MTLCILNEAGLIRQLHHNYYSFALIGWKTNVWLTRVSNKNLEKNSFTDFQMTDHYKIKTAVPSKSTKFYKIIVLLGQQNAIQYYNIHTEV